MSSPVFNFTSPAAIVAQPGGDTAIFVSDNAADTGNLSLTGLVSGTSTTETAALTGKKEVIDGNVFTTLSHAKLSAAQAGTVRVYDAATGLNARGFIFYNSLPANNDTLVIGLVGYTRTYTYKSTLSGAADEIHIAASTTAQATNLYRALTAGAGAGTDYGTGTTQNLDIVPTTPSGANVPITDTIPIARQLAWSFSQTGTAHSLQVPIGGVTGTLLATLAAGVTQAYNSFSLSTEDLATATLPALFTGSSDPLQVGGKSPVLRLKGAGISSGVAMNYKTSTDGVNWATGAASISNVTNSHTVAAPQRVIPTEQNVEYLQLNIATNANTSDVNVDARAIFG